MTDRRDIEPRASGYRKLSYTSRCGWVDWGHAIPDGPAKLKKQLDFERSDWPLLNKTSITLNGAPAFIVVYGQAMKAAGVAASVERHWVVNKGLSATQKKSVALAIFLSASHDFERMQAGFPFSLVTNSGYSPEDLVSNLIGFYGAYLGLPQKDFRKLCGEVSVKESFRIWDTYLPNGFDGLKNKTPQPIYFPCQECANDSQTGTFPAFFSSIAPSAHGYNWVKPARRFIDGRLINMGIPLTTSNTGVIKPATQRW
ncbi:MAG: hypothetical protein COA42_09295 [Alteromonadaceae bacterium]|nr:MAG: hypothetical protein COA42_09295 [Alteromonadaceae bacterium]